MYLNANQKHALVKLYACSDFLAQAADKADKHMPKEALTALKHARTWSAKSWDKWLSQVDDKSSRGVVNMVRDFEVGIMTKRGASNDIKEMSAYLSGKEYVERMAEVTMEAKCSRCDGTVRDTCSLYESYVHFEVATFDDKHPNCPYAQLEVEA